MAPKRRRKAKPVSAIKRSRNDNKVPHETNREAESSDNPNMTSSRDLTSPFLSLPRELRDQIYHEIWMSKPAFEVALTKKGDHHGAGQEHRTSDRYHIFTIEYHPTEIPACNNKFLRNDLFEWPEYSVPGKKNKTPSPWILANRQILREAMDQFNHKASWTFSASNAGRRGRQLAAWRLSQTNRPSTRLGPILLALRNAAAIHVPNQSRMRVYAEMDPSGAPFLIVELEINATNLFTSLGVGLAGTMNLQQLSLHIHALDWWLGPQDQPVVVDLKVLDSLHLPNLQLLKLCVTVSDKFCQNQTLVRALRDAISTTGNLMLGGEGQETFRDFTFTKPGLDPYLVWTLLFKRC